MREGKGTMFLVREGGHVPDEGRDDVPDEGRDDVPDEGREGGHVPDEGRGPCS